MLISFIPIILLIMGLGMYFFPPKKINSFIGYRSNKSMKDQESWDYAQKMSGYISTILGFVMLIATVIAYLILEQQGKFGFYSTNVIVFIQLAALVLGTLLPMEILLTRRGKNEKNEKN